MFSRGYSSVVEYLTADQEVSSSTLGALFSFKHKRVFPLGETQFLVMMCVISLLEVGLLTATQTESSISACQFNVRIDNSSVGSCESM